MLEDDDTNTLSCYVDVALAVQSNKKSHTVAVYKMEKGAIISSSLKQKLNSQSSTWS